MPNTKARILIVDDEPSIRKSLSYVLDAIGYCVRTAEDGLSALSELHREIPDILLSDLNMPGMSGFELLSEVRRRFPAIQTIAMSGAFSGDEAPSGIPVDSFYPKGSSVGCLLKILDTLARSERMVEDHATALEPIWIQQPITDQQQGADHPNVANVTISCPDCMRSFSHPFGNSNSQVQAVHCVHCNGLIHYAVVESILEQAKQTRDSQRSRFEGNLQAAAPPYFL